ncbi:hypothetical protein BXY66_3870 [Shimia isoporae]|uniref:Uncharacterized protein n=1 Tax=Shimia isoporae TaxID=647720 RepID=A0A4R1N7U9_9RHOB|nr:hypothetical protein [Shimia isoporae]TCK99368.1 hypothetical protein BXY66_3870 [Shimia isoporae]
MVQITVTGFDEATKTLDLAAEAVTDAAIAARIDLFNEITNEQNHPIDTGTARSNWAVLGLGETVNPNHTPEGQITTPAAAPDPQINPVTITDLTNGITIGNSTSYILRLNYQAGFANGGKTGWVDRATAKWPTFWADAVRALQAKL